MFKRIPALDLRRRQSIVYRQLIIRVLLLTTLRAMIDWSFLVDNADRSHTHTLQAIDLRSSPRHPAVSAAFISL